MTVLAAPPIRPVDDRLREHSERATNGCLLWTGATYRNGYGIIRLSQPRRVRGVHRVAFETWVRPLEPGEVVDHDCHNEDESCPGGWTCWHRPCIEPLHLVGRTNRENILLGRSPAALAAMAVECPAGHAYSEENIYWWGDHRQCRTCRTIRDRNR